MKRRLSPRSIEAHLRLLIMAGIVIGIVLRFVRLGRQSLWVDEMLTIINAHIGGTLEAADVFRNLQGPMISSMIHLWGGLSTNEIFLRIPFAAAGALTVYMVYILARKLVGSRTALYTTFVVALSPVLIWYSQEVRGYAFAVLFSVLMTYFFTSWLVRPTKASLMFYGMSLFAGLVSNLSVAFVAAAHFLYLIVAPGRRKFLGRWIVAVFIVLLVFSPWLREIMVRIHPEKVITGDEGAPLTGGAALSAMVVPYAFFTYSVGYSLGPSVREIKMNRFKALQDNIPWIVLAGLVFAVPVVAGARTLLRTSPSLAILIALWIAVPVLAVIVLAARNVRVFTPRYALVAVPAYALVVGQGLSALTRSRFWPITLVLTCVVGMSIYNHFTSRRYDKDDSREAASVIMENFAEGDVVVGVFTTEPLSHYLDGAAGVEIFGADDIKTPETMAARCRAMTQGARRIWLSLCREWMVDPEGHIHAWFNENLDLVDTYKLTGIQVFLYQKRSE